MPKHRAYSRDAHNHDRISAYLKCVDVVNSALGCSCTLSPEDALHVSCNIATWSVEKLIIASENLVAYLPDGWDKDLQNAEEA